MSFVQFETAQSEGAQSQGAHGETARARILITGFEPFHQWTVNSSWEGVKRVAARRRDVAALRLPVDHAAAAEAIGAALARHRPEIVLMTGLADDRECRLERIGRDLSGRAFSGAWRWAEAERAIRAAGGAVRASEDAGGYVCDTSYAAALAVRDEGARPSGDGPVAVAFLHVPPLSERWPVERIADAIEAALVPYDRDGAA